jgi:high affinity Mn2+ porin
MTTKFVSAIAVWMSIGVVAVSTANAAEILPTKAPPPPPPPPLVQNWTGFYGGVSIGYASGDVKRGTPILAATDSISPSSFVATLIGGYDYQFANNVVLGARLLVPFFSLSDSVASGGFTFQGKVKNAVIGAGRLGYSFGHWMPYILAGGVWATGQAEVVGIAKVDAHHTGYILGLGAEYRLYRNWSIDALYSYVSVGKETYNFAPFGGVAVVYGYESHNFTVAANYRF